MGTLAGWAYRKAITVNHTDDGAQTNYQMKLTVNHGDGADSTGLVYLNHHALNWPTDIQITASDGTTPVDFWREESDATDGTWWIECPSIPDGGTWTGYIYYGDADAADVSSGANTFKFFDNFEDNDFSDWTLGPGTEAIESGSPLFGSYSFKYTGSGSNTVTNHVSQSIPATSYRAKLWFKLTNQGAGSYTPFVILWMMRYTDATHCWMIDSYYSTNQYLRLLKVETSASAISTVTWLAGAKLGTSTTYELMIEDTGSHIHVYINGSLKIDTAYTATVTSNVKGMGYDVDSAGLYDNVLVANYTANEPTWAASGAEEALGSTIKSVPRNTKILLMSA